MTSLGDLSGPTTTIELDFEWFGHTIRVNPNASDLDLVEFMIDGTQTQEADDVASMHALGRYMQRLIHPEDFRLFWDTAKDHGQGLEQILKTTQTIEAAIADFRTGQPGVSSGGPATTAPKSKAVSSRPAAHGRSGAVTEQETAQVLQLFRGRPDLQTIVIDADQARRAEADRQRVANSGTALERARAGMSAAG